MIIFQTIKGFLFCRPYIDEINLFLFSVSLGREIS